MMVHRFLDKDYEFQEDKRGMYMYMCPTTGTLLVVNRVCAVFVDGTCLGVGSSPEDAMDIGLAALVRRQDEAQRGGDEEDGTKEVE